MAADTIVWLVVAAVVVLIGAGALREHKKQRALKCRRCGRSGPFPERVIMALRKGQPANCPDCGTLLAPRGASRST